MTARKPASTPATPSKTAGERLIAELSKPDDPYSLQFLIEQTGQIADYLDHLNALLRGDRDTWLQVKIGAKTVEVVVTNVLVQQRQQAEQLRKLIAEIHRQRTAIEMGGDDDDDVLAGI